MQQRRTFTIIGGDGRSVRLANLLHEEGHVVNVYGIYNHPHLHAPCTADPAQAIYEGKILLFPLPMLNKDGAITAPYSDTPISTEMILKYITDQNIVLAGKIPDETKKQLDLRGVRSFDYFSREDLTVTNAMITSEGAVQTLLENYPDTLCGSEIMILGFGRIGKFLAKILSGFGCRITIAGRRSDVKAWVESLGFSYADVTADASFSNKFNIIINTIPSPVLTNKRLCAISENCLILDLASGEGGTDFVYAQSRGIRAIHALSLPGKTAPLAAGTAIKKAIIQICDELEV